MNRSDFKKSGFFAALVPLVCPALFYQAAHGALSHFLALAGVQQKSAGASCLLMLPMLWLFSRKGYYNRKKTFKASQALSAAAAVILLSISAAGATVLMQEKRICETPSLLLVIGSCIAGPICEEIVYRGAVFNAAQRFWGRIPALLFSSVLFGAAHTESVLSAVMAAAAGTVLCTVMIDSQSILIAAAVHCAVNLISFTDKIYQMPEFVYIFNMIGLIVFLLGMIGKIKIKGE